MYSSVSCALVNANYTTASTAGRTKFPIDPNVGVMDEDLKAARLRTLDLSGEDARAFALRYSWEESARTFRNNIILAHGDKLEDAA